MNITAIICINNFTKYGMVNIHKTAVHENFKKKDDTPAELHTAGTAGH